MNIYSLNQGNQIQYDKTKKLEKEEPYKTNKDNKESLLSENKSVESRIKKSYDTYTSTKSIGLRSKSLSFTGGLQIDKGTAKETTVFVNRQAYDKILSASTHGEPKWDEMGIDGEKRWVVINGQRFECELSPEEKAQRNRAQKTLIDYLLEKDDKKEKQKDNGTNKPTGNLDALENNPEVMNLLGRIFNTNDTGAIFKQLA